MAMTITDALDNITEPVLEYEQLDPNVAAIPLPCGDDMCVTLASLDDGGHLSVQTIEWRTCHRGLENFQQVMSTINRLNATYRILQFAWDPDDGQIHISAGVPVVGVGSAAVGEQVKTVVLLLASSLTEAAEELDRWLGASAQSTSPLGSVETADAHGMPMLVQIGIVIAAVALLIFAVGSFF